MQHPMCLGVLTNVDQLKGTLLQNIMAIECTTHNKKKNILGCDSCNHRNLIGPPKKCKVLNLIMNLHIFGTMVSNKLPQISDGPCEMFEKEIQ